MELENRRALVTGGGRGIGRAVAVQLARAGAAVAVAARTRKEIDECVSELRTSGATAHAVTADVSKDADVRALFRDAEQTLGPIDILVNGAGVAPSALLHRTTDEQWRSVIDVNLSGCFYAMRAALPGMLQRGWGRIVNMASIAGKTGYPYIAAYSASKHGLLGLTRCAAVETAEKGVTVNAVCPGYVDTPMTDASIDRIVEKTGIDAAAARRHLEEASPQKRLVTAEEVAALTVYLCTDAARGITGQALSVDGGTVL